MDLFYDSESINGGVYDAEGWLEACVSAGVTNSSDIITPTILSGDDVAQQEWFDELCAKDQVSLGDFLPYFRFSWRSVSERWRAFRHHRLTEETILSSIFAYHWSNPVANWAQAHLLLGRTTQMAEEELMEVTMGLLPPFMATLIDTEGGARSFDDLCSLIATTSQRVLRACYISRFADSEGHLLAMRASLESMLREVDSLAGRSDPDSSEFDEESEVETPLDGPTISITVSEPDASEQLLSEAQITRDPSGNETLGESSMSEKPYRMVVRASRFRMGTPITVEWWAPTNHSRKDWIGIYPVGANSSQDETTINSYGLWVPIYGEEWKGDTYLGGGDVRKEKTNGAVMFKRQTLPWQTGLYEIRYHHDGEFKVLDCVGPLEIYVDKPQIKTFMAIHESLWQSVYLCLDEDPALLARHTTSTSVSAIDTFRCEEEAHPRRICTLIKECFGIIFTVEDIGRFTSISDMAAAILAELESTA